jgi:hypothetical protein
MQISKSFLMLCAGAALLLPVYVRGLDQDTEVQAKAREALERKMRELQSQSSVVSTSHVRSSGALSAPNASEEEVKKQVAARVKAREEAEKAAKAEAEAKRKEEAKRKAEQESQAKAEARLKAEQEARAKAQAQPKVQKEVVAQKSSPVQAPTGTAPVAAPTGTAPVTAPPSSSTATQAKPAEKEPVAAQTVQSTPPQQTPKPTASTAKGAPAFQPIAGPPVNLSADQQQRLAELLRKYQADEITPEQYHTERMKIVGGR